MKKCVRVFGLAAITALQAAGSLAGTGVPVTYTKLVWSFSSTAAALSGCNEIVMDATGDIITSDNLLLSGALNCGINASAVYGAAYFGATGTLNMSFNHGSFITVCGRMINFAGTCNTIDGTGTQRGITTVRLR